MKRYCVVPVLAIALCGVAPGSSAGQPVEDDKASMPAPGTVTISLEEAVQLALIHNYALRQARLDEQDILHEVSQSWAPLWPSIDGTASYTRNIFAPNPFAGTAAGAAFGGPSAAGWVEFNALRQNAGGTTLSFEEYNQALFAAQRAQGVLPDPDANPFLVENQIQLSLVIRQVLYDGAVFAGLRGTDVAKQLARVGVDSEALTTMRSVASAFYGALLAERQTGILTKSVERTQATVDETKQRVERGVVAQFDLLTAEVELANLQTNLARANNSAAKALDDLRLVVGLPANRTLKPKGELTLDGVAIDVPTDREAVELAFASRPDLKQAELMVEAQRIQESATWGRYLPKINAVANLAYSGSIPDDRTAILNSSDPFRLSTTTNAVFSDSFWFSSVSVGATIEWAIFEGFEVTEQRARDRVATMKAKVQLEQALASVELEVQQALRELKTARQQIESQKRNRERAELNYEHAQVRVREGVSSQFELRQASQQLDESRFNYLQAVHDFLVARIAYLVAVGTPPIQEKGPK